MIMRSNVAIALATWSMVTSSVPKTALKRSRYSLTLPRRSMEALRRLNAQLNDGGLEAELSPLLTADEIAATKARVETLLEHRVHPYPPENWPAVPWPPV